MPEFLTCGVCGIGFRSAFDHVLLTADARIACEGGGGTALAAN